MYVALTGESGDRVQALYSRIQKEYGIELTDSVVASVECEPYYSRDYACVAAMKLTEEYAQALERRFRTTRHGLARGNRRNS